MILKSCFNARQAHKLFGDFATRIEFEFSSRDSPAVQLKAKYGNYVDKGFYMKAIPEGVRGQLHVFGERANRVLIRNLRGLRELQRGQPGHLS